MKRIILSIWLCVAAMYSFSQQNQKYLTGAVPEKNGKVYFSKTIKAGQLSKDEIYKVISDWSNHKFALADGFRRKVLSTDSVQRSLMAVGDDYLVFQNTLLSLDRAHLLYNFTANCVDGACEISFFRITYLYKLASNDVPEKYTAEEMISDGNAIKKGKLVRSSAKFRTKTIDYIESVYAEIDDLLGKETLKKINK
jgi:Domain of unknown function (DUF4468) with TBP-like fold